MPYQHSSKLTPFEVVYGRAPPIVSIFFQDGSTNIVVCASFLQQDRSLSYFEGQFLASPRAYKD
uniref:Putative ovule protein n=1 Tax=Solanum chacoense TaxID=4108 RepID=A0A0V0GX07_SOLCH